MAIKTNLTTIHGIELVGAYVRVEYVVGDKENIIITVRTYVSQKMATDGGAFIEEKSYIFPPNVTAESDNFIKQGYEYLKTLMMYKDATDIIESNNN